MDSKNYNSWAISSPPKKESIYTQHDTTPIRETNFSNQIFTNLKKNYEERVRSLELHMRETLGLIEKDDMLNTMRLNQTSSEFTKQRVLEILEESLQSEKEAAIEKLNQANSQLKAELVRTQEEIARQRKYFQNENELLRSALDQLEATLRSHDQATLQREQQCEQLRHSLQEIAEHYENQLKLNDNKYHQNMQILHEEIGRLSREVEDFRNAAYEIENGKTQRERTIEEMRNDIEVLRIEYTKIEKNYQSLIAEHTVVSKNSYLLQEINRNQEQEIGILKSQVLELKNELSGKSHEYLITNRGKEELSSQVQSLQNQIMKVSENEQKTISNKTKEVKEKYKTKIKGLKEKLAEFKEANEALRTENFGLKNTIEDRKLHYERLIISMQNDMKTIKNEWENKCQEIELNSQRIIAELKAKHQLQINQLQGDYQSLIDRRASDTQSETTANLLNKSARSLDVDLRTNLENRISQMEKEYISKTKHENILTEKIMEFKATHTQNMKELEEKYEQEIQARVRQLADKSKVEYEAALNSIKTIIAANRLIEEQKADLIIQVENLRALVEGERENKNKIVEELAQSEQNRKKFNQMLIAKLDESSSCIHKLKLLYESEANKAGSFENDSEELQRRLEELNEIQSRQNTSINELKAQVADSNKRNIELEKKIIDLQSKEKEHEKQRKELESTIAAINKEKDDLYDQIADLNEQLLQESTSVVDKISTIRQEESRKLDNELIGKLQLKTNLQQAETKLKIQLNENTELQKKLKEIKAESRKLEEQVLEVQNQNDNLKGEKMRYEHNLEELNRKLERSAKSYKDKLTKVSKLAGVKISHLRTEYESLKKTVNLELHLGNQSLLESSEELQKFFDERVKYVKDNLEKQRDKSIDLLSNEYQSKMKTLEAHAANEKQKVQEEYEKTIKLSSSTLEQIKKEFALLKEENTQLLELLDIEHEKSIELQGKIARLESERDKLKEFTDEKTEEFQNLQKFVEREVRRIKEESEDLLANNIEQIEEKYSRELERAALLLDNLYSANLARLSSIGSEVSQLQAANESESEHARNNFKIRIENYEKELDLLENEYLNVKRENHSFATEVEILKEKCKQLQEENTKTVSEFEEKLNALDRVSRNDSDRYTQQKSQFGVDVERYQREVRLLRQELEAKENLVKDLERRNEKLEVQFLKLKSQPREKQTPVQLKQHNPTKTSKYRDRELEDLQTILAKSIKSFNQSIETNLRIANQFDREAEEFTRSIRAERSINDLNDEKSF